MLRVISKSKKTPSRRTSICASLSMSGGNIWVMSATRKSMLKKLLKEMPKSSQKEMRTLTAFTPGSQSIKWGSSEPKLSLSKISVGSRVQSSRFGAAYNKLMLIIIRLMTKIEAAKQIQVDSSKDFQRLPKLLIGLR